VDDTPGFAKLDFSHLKMTLAGGMALQATLRHFGSYDGGRAHTGMGLTELRRLCVSPCGRAVQRHGGFAPLLYGVVARDDSGHELPLGQTGSSVCEDLR